MLEIRELTRRFGELVAVDGVSFTVPPEASPALSAATARGRPRRSA
jgi:ABC-type branched-subunit amino acid transport system ATPase component